MGNGESKNNNLDQTTDQILKEINMEIENTTFNLLKCQSSTETLTNHRKHVKELKTKLIAFYKSIQISNKITNQNLKESYSDLERNLRLLKINEIYDKENLGKYKNQCKQYLKDITKLESALNIEKKVKQEQEDLIEDLKEELHARDETISKHKENNGVMYELNKHKRLLDKAHAEKEREKNLRETAEKKADSLLKEIETLRFQIQQKNDKLEKSDELIEIQNLNKVLELRNAEHVNKLLGYKLEINQLTDELKKTNHLTMEKIRETNKHKPLIEKQNADIKDLQDQLKQCQGDLRDERKIKIDQVTKIELIRQYCDQLKNELEANKIEQERQRVTFEEEITQLTNVLSLMKTDVCKCKPELTFVKQSYDDLKKELDIKETERNTEEKVHKKEINRLTNLNKRLQARLRTYGNNFANENMLRKEAEVKTKLLEKQISDFQQKLKNSQIDAGEKDELRQLRQRCSHLEKVMEIKETEHETEKVKYEKEVNAVKSDLLKLQEDYEQDTILRENLEKHVLMLEKQVGILKKLESKLEICQEHLEKEKNVKQGEMLKLQLAKEELELIKEERNKELLDYEKHRNRMCKYRRLYYEVSDYCSDLEMSMKKQKSEKNGQRNKF